MSERLTRLAVVAILGGCSLFAQTSQVSAGCLDRPDHLEPPDSVLASFDQSFEYQVAVRKALLEGQSDRPYFRVIGLPAFFSEWSLTIGTPAAGESRVEIADARKPVYTGNGYRRPTIDRTFVTIDARLAETLREVLEKMLLDTRPCGTRDGLAGRDGETYMFSGFILNRGVLSGETWSPHEDTRAGQLVSSVTLLFRIAHAVEADQLSLRRKLLESVNALRNQVLGEGS